MVAPGAAAWRCSPGEQQAGSRQAPAGLHPLAAHHHRPTNAPAAAMAARRRLSGLFTVSASGLGVSGTVWADGRRRFGKKAGGGLFRDDGTCCSGGLLCPLCSIHPPACGRQAQPAPPHLLRLRKGHAAQPARRLVLVVAGAAHAAALHHRRQVVGGVRRVVWGRVRGAGWVGGMRGMRGQHQQQPINPSTFHTRPPQPTTRPGVPAKRVHRSPSATSAPTPYSLVAASRWWRTMPRHRSSSAATCAWKAARSAAWKATYGRSRS